MIYLASPYSHPNRSVRQMRFEAVSFEMARLMRQGYCVFSPVVISHTAIRWNGPESHEFWMRYCQWFIPHCYELFVLKLEGWEASIGVQQERNRFTEMKRPITYIDPSTVGAEQLGLPLGEPSTSFGAAPQE